jgi:hypothetical protein
MGHPYSGQFLMLRWPLLVFKHREPPMTGRPIFIETWCRRKVSWQGLDMGHNLWPSNMVENMGNPWIELSSHRMLGPAIFGQTHGVDHDLVHNGGLAPDRLRSCVASMDTGSGQVGIVQFYAPSGQHLRSLQLVQSWIIAWWESILLGSVDPRIVHFLQGYSLCISFSMQS